MMNVILKPAGIVSVLTIFGATLYMVSQRQQKIVTSMPKSVGGMPKTASGTPGGWSVSDNARTVTQTALGLPQREYPVPGSGKALPAHAGTYALTLRGVTLGSSPFPKYGVRFRTTGQLRYVDAWIDPRTKVLATCGEGIRWQNSPLPTDFDMTKDHRIHAVWKEDGLYWQFMVDDDTTTLQERRFSRASPAHHVAVVVEDAAAIFRLDQ